MGPRVDRRGVLAPGPIHRGEELTAFGVEAGIAACHAAAPTFADTDWSRIGDLSSIRSDSRGMASAQTFVLVVMPAAILVSDALFT